VIFYNETIKDLYENNMGHPKSILLRGNMAYLQVVSRINRHFGKEIFRRTGFLRKVMLGVYRMEAEAGRR
jgi:hypothetical protein